MKLVHFELKDSQGEIHKYEVELFSCDENASLQLKVVKPLLQAVGRAVSAIMPALDDEIKEGLKELIVGDAVPSIDPKLILDVVSKISWDTMPEAFGALPETVAEHGGPALVAQVFSRTTRLIENKEAAGAPTIDDQPADPYLRQELRDSRMRDMAFGDANFGEYWLAFASVLVVNFTQAGRGELLSWKKLFSAMTGGLLKPSIQSSETQTPKTDSPLVRAIATP